ncbi:MAG: hypothetical protein PVH29_12395, partial [Candidatus Zixiibacteriota bacterium]
MRKTIIMFAAGALAAAAFADLAIVESWPSPGLIPYGVAHDGSYVWVSCDEAGKESLYKCDPGTGSVLSSFRVETSGLLACAYDGSYLWYDALNSSLEYYLYQADDAGSVLSSWKSPLNRTVGVAWDGSHLWLTSYYSNMGWVTTAGSLVGSFDTAWRPTGAAYDGEYLWTAEYNTAKLYRLTTAGSLLATYTFPAGEPWGLDFDGEYLWATNKDGAGTIYKVNISSDPAVTPASFGGVRALY